MDSPPDSPGSAADAPAPPSRGRAAPGANGARSGRKSPAPAAKGAGRATRAAKGAGRATRAAKEAGRATRAAKGAPPRSPAGGGSRPAAGFERTGWRSARNRTLYDRRTQRASEHWPLATRLASRLFSHPDLVLGLMGRRAPVEVGGRVLNRGTQALLELANRIQSTAGGGREAAAVYDPITMRPQLTRMSRAAMPVRTDVYVIGRVVPGPDGAPDIPLRVYRQFGTAVGGRHRPQAIVYYHGGGWVTGELDSHDALCRILAAVSGCIVVAVGYRLAPEDPFPAAVDDALAGYAWVQRHSDELGHPEGQVGVMGDSAGGNLAAVVALETRRGGRAGERDVPPPVAQGLIYPALDARLDSESLRALGDGFLLTRESMEFFRACYLPDRDQWETARVSPILADDHHGLAPALVVTAGFDPVRDDGANYAEALRRSGVEVEYRCYDDQVHGFMGMGMLPDSLALATEVCDSMGRLMRRSVPAATGA